MTVRKKAFFLKRYFIFGTLLLMVCNVLPSLATASDLSSYAFINDDGTLRIRSKTIHLFGIYIPPTDKICRDFIRPVKCAPRAALALDFKINGHFVHCDIRNKKPNGSLIGICRADGDDLAAYLLQRGWAAALPEAPPEYAILERIARSKGLGVWGFPVDNIITPLE